MFPFFMPRDTADKEWFIDVDDRKPPKDLGQLQRDLSRMGFSPLFVQKFAELRWELVDGLPLSVADRVN